MLVDSAVTLRGLTLSTVSNCLRCALSDARAQSMRRVQCCVDCETHRGQSVVRVGAESAAGGLCDLCVVSALSLRCCLCRGRPLLRPSQLHRRPPRRRREALIFSAVLGLNDQHGSLWRNASITGTCAIAMLFSLRSRSSTRGTSAENSGWSKQQHTRHPAALSKPESESSPRRARNSATQIRHADECDWCWCCRFYQFTCSRWIGLRRSSAAPSIPQQSTSARACRPPGMNRHGHSETHGRTK